MRCYCPSSSSGYPSSKNIFKRSPTTRASPITSVATSVFHLMFETSALSFSCWISAIAKMRSSALPLVKTQIMQLAGIPDGEYAFVDRTNRDFKTALARTSASLSRTTTLGQILSHTWSKDDPRLINRSSFILLDTVASQERARSSSSRKTGLRSVTMKEFVTIATQKLVFSAASLI